MQDYDLGLGKVTASIKNSKAKFVCVQLPDGLKPEAKHISDIIEQETCAKAIIWLGSCFGSCDMPANIERLGVDMVIQWGHAEW